MLEITRVFTDINGNSHFENEPVTMELKSIMGFHSELEKNIDNFCFQNVLPHHSWEFHTVSKKVYIIILQGELELEVSNGEKKQFGCGNVILLDDDSGQGHKPKTFKNTVCGLVITMK